MDGQRAQSQHVTWPERFGPKPPQLKVWPKPDLCYGFKYKWPDKTAEPPFQAFWKEQKHFDGDALLSLKGRLKFDDLHPEPVLGCNFVWPCYIHEVKAQLGSLYAAANQLSKSLAYALDQQEELRKLAGAPETQRLPVFGAASEGFQVKLWCAAYVGSKIVSLATQNECGVL